MDRRSPTVNGVFHCPLMRQAVNSLWTVLLVLRIADTTFKASALVVGAQISSVICGETLNRGETLVHQSVWEKGRQRIRPMPQGADCVGRKPGNSSANTGLIRVRGDARGCPQGLALLRLRGPHRCLSIKDL